MPRSARAAFPRCQVLVVPPRGRGEPGERPPRALGALLRLSAISERRIPGAGNVRSPFILLAFHQQREMSPESPKKHFLAWVAA